MRLKAVIFDVDGTLAETEETHRHAFNRAFAEAWAPWRWSQRDYRALLTTTGGRERIARYLSELDFPPDPTGVAAMHIRKNAFYAEMVEAGDIVPRPGVVRLIDECRRKGVTMAIATTTSRANLDALLRATFAPDAASWFAVIATGEDVTAKKPNPEVYRLVLDKLGLDAADCVAIEDSANGLLAARACAIPTLVTPSIYSIEQDFSGATLVCDSLDDAASPIDLARLERLIAAT